MATYAQLYAVSGGNTPALMQQIIVATMIEAQLITALPTPTAPQLAFAQAALANPQNYLQIALNYILAQYNTQAVTAITGASDAAVQAAVHTVVTTMLGL